MLAGKLVLVVAIHSLGGSCANRHHMPIPQPGAAQPTQDGDPQVTSNPLELPFVISHGEGTRTLTIHQLEPETSTTLCSTILVASRYLGGSNHQK